MMDPELALLIIDELANEPDVARREAALNALLAEMEDDEYGVDDDSTELEEVADDVEETDLP
jgi:hypothetical protein